MKMRVLQRFDGTVISAPNKGEFQVILRDLTDTKRSEEKAIMNLCDVSKNDLHLVAPGAIFDWTIYWRPHPTKESGQSLSKIRFSRKRWTRAEIQQIKQKARTLGICFGLKP